MKLAIRPRRFRAYRLTAALVFLPVFLIAGGSWAFDQTYTAYGDSVLAVAVVPEGVDYDTLVANPAPLKNFLAACAAVPFEQYSSWSAAEQQAFLINLYNAALLKLVVDHWPLANVRDIGSLFASAWTLPCVDLFGRSIGLGNIEHDILRPQFKDPRIHFALSTAAVSGPRLNSRPYQPEFLDAQLQQQADGFLRARPAVNRYETGTLYLSPLFKWYLHDFGKQAGLLRFLKNYFPDVTDKTPITYTDFDWSLDQK